MSSAFAASAAHPQPGSADSSSLWAIGSWLSAALDDPSVCAEMKRDIREWFDGGGHSRAAPDRGAGIDNPECSNGIVVKPPATEYGAQDPCSVVERVKRRLALSRTYVWLNRTDVEALLVEALRSDAMAKALHWPSWQLSGLPWLWLRGWWGE